MTAISHTARMPNTLRIAGQLFRPCSSSAGPESATHSPAKRPTARVATMHREMTDHSAPARGTEFAGAWSFPIPTARESDPALRKLLP